MTRRFLDLPRLLTGIFYAQGVKANVLLFDRKPAQEKPHTMKLCIYDLRTNLHFTLKENTLKRTNLDIFWVKDDALEDSANLPSPEIITADLEAVLEQFATIAEDLK